MRLRSPWFNEPDNEAGFEIYQEEAAIIPTNIDEYD